MWGIYENVKNIVGKRFKETFDMFINELHEYGYNTYYKVLNAKNYGIPQNRERVYLIIIKKDFDIGNYMPSNHEAGRVVDINGISPCVKENHGTVTGILQKKL